MSDESVTVYAGTDGSYLTQWELDRKIATGDWRPCLCELSTGWYLVEVAEGELLGLTERSLETLPRWVEVRTDGDVSRVIDCRRTKPPGVRGF